eukprot:augustus_masked-scaffold_10-processed-gene-3.1-mRNA-1 protein AED:1.00 eAED:1.00 QI:0/-1/0/0/-1/1/1/0/131
MHLFPRWHFDNHPLFIVAMKELGRAESSEDDALNFNVKVVGFKDLLVPKKSGIRYSMLQSACKMPREKPQYSADEEWRKAYAAVIRVTDTFRQNADGNFSNGDMSLSQHSRLTNLPLSKTEEERNCCKESK